MIEQLTEFLRLQGFEPIRLNTEGIWLFYKKTTDSFYVITIYWLPNGNEMTQEQFLNVEKQIQNKVLDAEKESVSVSFLCTNNADAVHRFLKTSSHTGIIDLTQKKLYIYEEMPEKFSEIYTGMERIIDAQIEQTAAQRTTESLMKKIGVSTVSLILINTAVFFILSVTGMQNTAVRYGALSYQEVINNREVYRIFTSMFLHAGIEHLLYNMLTLGMIGSTLEKITGPLKYLFLYLGSGVISAIVSMGYKMSQNNPAVSIGASGAIFGIIGAVLYIVLRNKGKAANIGKRQIILFVLLSLYGGFTSSGVDNIAHVGGLFGGILLTALCYHIKTKDVKI